MAKCKIVFLGGGSYQWGINIARDISPNCDCHGENDAAILPDQGQHQMERIHLAMAMLPGQTLGIPQGFLGFGCQIVVGHGGSFLSGHLG